MSGETSMDSTLNQLEQKAGDYEEMSRSCLQESFNMADPAEREEFKRAEGYKRCRVPPGRVARIAGEILMEGREPC